MSERLPAPIDRAAFERVLQRAAELQASSRDIGEGLSEDEVIALGREVGIPEAQLRQALLEERTRVAPPAPEGFLDRAIAPVELQADRVVQGTETEVAEALTALLDRREHFTVQRATLGRITYEPLDPFAGAMRKLKRVFDSDGGKSYLDKAELVTAVITPLEPGFCHVTLQATLRKSRTAYLAGGSTLAGTGGVAGGLAVVLGAPEVVLLAAALPSAGFGWLVARGFRPISARASLGLARLLDELERRPARAIGSGASAEPKSRVLAREVGNVVRDITTEVRKALEEKK